jgi:hypothetical protein
MRRVLISSAVAVSILLGCSASAAAVSPLPPTSAAIPSAPAGAPSTVTICDAVQIAALPPCAAYLAYVDGRYRTYSALHAKYPTATILTVSTTGQTAADILDVEPGNAQPPRARLWVTSGLGSAMGDIIYSDRADYPRLQKALAGLSWKWYAADPTGAPHIVPGSIATQYAWPRHGSPGNYDISLSVGLLTAAPVETPPSIPSPNRATLSPLP